MVVVRTPGGQLISVRTPGPGDVVVQPRRSRQTTRTTPTPSASDLRGSSSEKEAQLAAFRSGGQTAFLRSRQLTIDRIAREKAAMALRKEAGRQEDIRQQQAIIAAENRRIAMFSAKLRQQNAQVISKTFKDSGVRHETLINPETGERIFTVTNLKTGKKTIKTFEKDGGNRVRLTGGIVTDRRTPVLDTLLIKQTLAFQKLVKDLPKGVTFVKDKAGNIIGIDDKNKGAIVPLSSLQNYVSGAKLIAVGLAEEIKTTVTPPPKETVTSFFKGIAGAFSAEKRRNEREKQRQDYYDFYGLTGSARNFVTLLQVARNKKLNVPEQQRFNKIVMDDFKQDILSKDTAIRAEAALIVAAIAGGVLIGGTVGAIYKTPIALAKDKGIENLKDVTWKDVAKMSGIEFGKNAVQSYIALKLFGLGTKAISKVPAIAKFGLTKAGLKSSGILGQKVLQTGLKKGLDVAGAHYLSSVGVDVAKTVKKVKEKRYKAATVSASGLLGTLVGFYGEKVVKGALRKVMLKEDPRLILTAGTRAKPFAIEARDITVARLNRAAKLLKNKKLRVQFAKASPVKEPSKAKIVTPEKRTARGVKIDVPTVSGYATYAVGKNVYLIPRTFLKIRPGNTPKSYYTKWFSNIKTKGFLPTIKELGLPRLKSPTVYKGSGEYLPRKKGESLKQYYARGQRVSNKTKEVQVVIAPKTVLGSKQPELEIKTIYPNPKGVKAAVTRVKVGKDAFGHNVVVEIVAPKSLLARLKFKIVEKVKFKVEALKFLTSSEAKIAKRLVPRILENYKFIYKSKLKGASDARKHMLQVEKNFRKILKQYKIKASDAEIKAVSRLHDILKLRGLKVKDEPIIRKALLGGHLNGIPLVKKLKPSELKRVANAIGFHQDVNPRTLRALKLDKFTKAFINSDRLDITRYGIKVNPKKMFNLKKQVPSKILKDFNKLKNLKLKNKLTATLRKRYTALLKKYPILKSGKIEDRIIKQNKAKYKKLSKSGKAKLRKQEKEYKDYKESSREYTRLKKAGKIKTAPYITSKYKAYRTPKTKAAYKNGYTAGHKYKNVAPANYKTNYGVYQSAYASGYKDAYKGKYNINYKTGKYKLKARYTAPTKKERKVPMAIKFKQKFAKKTIPRKVPVYYIKVKKKGRMVNLTPRPLRLPEAKDLLAWSVDRRLIRTGYFEPIGTAKRIVALPPKISGYFAKNKRKLRPYKIRVGKKKELRTGFIEKKKYVGDTKSEIRLLKQARAKKKVKKTKKKRR